MSLRVPAVDIQAMRSLRPWPATVAVLVSLLAMTGIHAMPGAEAAAARRPVKTTAPTAPTATPTPTPTPTPTLTSSTVPATSRSEVSLSRWAVARNGSTLQLEVCSNGSLTATDASVRRLVVVIHGDQREACSYASSVVKAADLAGQLADTLVVAPHFLSDGDLMADPSLAADTLYWSSGGWKSGAQSLTAPYSRPWTVSSYDVVDTLVRSLLTPQHLPSVSQLVIAGHSAGGQFVNRYAAGTASPSTDPAGVTRRYVVANPSSYLYWDANRRLGGSWRPLTATEKAACPGFDDYKYGLQRRSGYMAGVDVATLRSRYSASRVIYLLGDQDTDPADDSLDTGCAAELQGATRLERGLRYTEHLGLALTSAVYQRHTTTIVPGVGHSASAMFTSPAGQAALFG